MNNKLLLNRLYVILIDLGRRIPNCRCKFKSRSNICDVQYTLCFECKITAGMMLDATNQLTAFRCNLFDVQTRMKPSVNPNSQIANLFHSFDDMFLHCVRCFDECGVIAIHIEDRTFLIIEIKAIFRAPFNDSVDVVLHSARVVPLIDYGS